MIAFQDDRLFDPVGLQIILHIGFGKYTVIGNAGAELVADQFFILGFRFRFRIIYRFHRGDDLFGCGQVVAFGGQLPGFGL